MIREAGSVGEWTLLTEEEERQWMLDHTSQCCATCLFGDLTLRWKTDKHSGHMQVDWSMRCRRYPPVFVTGKEWEWEQPETAPIEWCGEWREDDNNS